MLTFYKKGIESGFSILELIIVVSILSIISSISIPTIDKWVRLSRIDAAKALVSTTAAECLQSLRTGEKASETTPKIETISNDGLFALGYKINSSESKCNEFSIVPSDENDDLLYSIGFRLNNEGKITKKATPPNDWDRTSENSCKLWAGENCGVSQEQLARWAAEDEIKAAKKTCDDNYYNWLYETKPNGGSGAFNRWDPSDPETTSSCNDTVWAFEGVVQQGETGFKAARDAKLGALCKAKITDKENDGYDGLFEDEECQISTYLFQGKDLGTSDKVVYDAEVEKKRQQECTAALGSWKNDGIPGKFSKDGCSAQWKCNEGGEWTIYTTLDDFSATNCSFSGPEDCRNPPHGQCRYEGSDSMSFCNNWYSRCNQYQ